MRKFTLMLAAAAMLSANVAMAQTETTVLSPAHKLSPANGASVTNLQGIELSFADDFVAFYENNKIPVAVLENTTTGTTYVCQEADRNVYAEATCAYFLNFVPEDFDSDAAFGALEAITEPGEYMLAIRGMYVEKDGENIGDVVPIYAQYKVQFPVDYTVTPAEGVVESLSVFSLEFPKNKNIEFYENSRMPVAVVTNGLSGNDEVTYNCEIERNTKAETEGIVYTLTMVDEDGEPVVITNPGAWNLTVKSLFMVGDTEDDNVDLPWINAFYTIEHPVAYTLEPASGTTVESLSSIVLTFATKNVEFYENNRMPIATLTNGLEGDYEVVYNCYEADQNTKAETDGIQYSLTFVDEDGEAVTITDPGMWYLTVKALCQVDEAGEKTDLPVVTANYYIEYPEAYVLNPNNGSYVEQLSTVTLSFENKSVKFYENNRMAIATLSNGLEGDAEVAYYAYTAEDTTAEDAEGVEYTLTFVDENEEPVVITAEGKWILTIKALYVEDAENEDNNYDLPVINAVYNVVYPAAYSLEPTNGSNLTSISVVTLQFPRNNNVAFYENNRMPIATLSNGLYGDEEVVYNCFEADRNVYAMLENGVEYSLQFVDEDGDAVVIDQPGVWTLTIKALYMEDAEGEKVDLPVIKANYQIEYPVSYMLTPGNNDHVAEISKVTVEFPDNRNVAFYEGNRMPVAVLSNGLLGDEEVAYYAYEAERNTFAETLGSEYSFTFVNEDEEPVVISQPGTWTLTIKGMYLEAQETEGEEGAEVENIDLPVINATYVIEYTYDYVLTPADGEVVEEVSSISLEFPTTKYVAFYENNRMPIATLTNGLEGDEEVAYNCYEAEMDAHAETDGKLFILNLLNEEDEVATVTTPGMWFLTIKGLYEVVVEGEEEVPGEDLPVINAVYYIENETGKVVDLTSPEGLYNVYGVNGVQVVRNGSVDSLKSLPAGLYIINGKKVMIRK